MISSDTVSAVKTMWPGLLPESGHGATWVPQAIVDPVLFSACMYGAAVHKQSHGVTASEGDLHAITASANETIHRLNQIMGDPHRAISDEVILTVLTLAFNWRDGPNLMNPDPHPRRPLQNLQWLAMYSGLPVNQVHVAGLTTLLTMRGEDPGSQTLPGLAPLLS